MEFYIRDSEYPDGPHDLMAAIRKIRNGSLTASTLISKEPEGEPVPAQSLPELATFFEDDNGGRQEPQHTAPARARGLGELITAGTDFLRNSIGAVIFSGVFMLIWLLIGYIFIFNGAVVEAMIGITLCYFLLGGYLYGVMRYLRGNPIDVKLIASTMMRAKAPMGIISVIVGMLMLPGLVLTHHVLSETGLLISLPIQFIFLFVVLSFFAFAPLLVVEKNYDFGTALQESVRVVKMGNNLGIVFALVSLNFILIPLMPVVLPVTMGALVEMYDDNFE